MPFILLAALGVFALVGVVGWGVLLYQSLSGNIRHLDRLKEGVAWLSWRPLPPLTLLVLCSAAAGGIVFSTLVFMGLSPFIGPDPHPVALLGVSVVTIHLPVAAAAFLWMGVHRVNPLQGMGLQPKDVASEALPGAAAYLLGLVLVAIGSQATAVIFPLFDLPVNPQPLVMEMDRVHGRFQIGLILFMGVLVGPFCEEVVFRGVLLPWLSRRVGIVAGLVLHSFLFALVHGHAAGILPLMGMSIMLGLVYLYRKSLMAAFWMHAIHNGMVFGMLFFSRSLEGV